MKKIFYYKLIRDLIPDKIKAKGSSLKTKKLTTAQFRVELLKKVGEEATGLLKATTKKDLASEIADIRDVLDEVAKEFKLDGKSIRAAQEANAKNKGGFKKRLYLIWSSDDKYRTNERKGNARLQG